MLSEKLVMDMPYIQQLHGLCTLQLIVRAWKHMKMCISRCLANTNTPTTQMMEHLESGSHNKYSHSSPVLVPGL